MPNPGRIAPPLILASGSPRRRELLARAGVPFETLTADIDERARPGERAFETAARLAAGKARSVARRLAAGPARLVLGADTLVVRDGEAIGKPESPAHAVEILARLVGRSHDVVTAVALVRSDTLALAAFHCESRVRMRAATRDELTRYVETGEPLDKAGAYALQGLGRDLVAGVEGSESNVIGLPLEQTLDALQRAGFDWPRP
jgi:septum formation protein